MSNKYIDLEGQVTREGIDLLQDFSARMDMDADTLWHDFNEDPDIQSDTDLRSALEDVVNTIHVLKRAIDPLVVLTNLAIMTGAGAERLRRIVRNRVSKHPELN